jgi:hypothetical protein
MAPIGTWSANGCGGTPEATLTAITRIAWLGNAALNASCTALTFSEFMLPTFTFIGLSFLGNDPQAAYVSYPSDASCAI